MSRPVRLLLATRARPTLRPGESWAFLGKSLQTAAALRDELGADRELRLGPRLRAIAEWLRQPWLDHVAALARVPGQTPRWYASAFASQSPFHTDSFLLLCEHALAQELAEEAGGPLALLVEDPWLHDALQEAWRARPGAEVPGSGVARLATAWRWRARGAAARGLYLARSVRGWLEARLRPPPASTRPDGTGVDVIVFAEERALRRAEFDDPYLGGLPRALEAAGHRVTRLVFPDVPATLRSRVRELRAARPMLADLPFRSLFRVLAPWGARGIPDATVGGVPAAWLLERARAEEARHLTIARALLVRDALAARYRRGPSRALIYFFENQPWEKVACQAAREAGVRTIGHQHASLPRFMLLHHLGEGDAATMPLPDRIVANGERAMRTLRESGYPPDRLVLGGALRYADATAKPPPPFPEDPRTILLGLPAERDAARAILRLVREAIDGLPDLRVIVRAHPDVPWSELDAPAHPRIAPTDETWTAALARAGVVLASGTTSIEARLAGRPVIRVVFENRLDLDPLAGRDVDGVQVVGPDGLADALARFAKDAPRALPPASALADDLAPPRMDVWLAEVRG